MTKKDYELIASVFAETYFDPMDFSAYSIVVPPLVEEFAKRLAKDNPRFNKEKFVAACYGEK
jgi:hypothetical protein